MKKHRSVPTSADHQGASDNQVCMSQICYQLSEFKLNGQNISVQCGFLILIKVHFFKAIRTFFEPLPHIVHLAQHISFLYQFFATHHKLEGNVKLMCSYPWTYLLLSHVFSSITQSQCIQLASYLLNLSPTSPTIIHTRQLEGEGGSCLTGICLVTTEYLRH